VYFTSGGASTILLMNDDLSATVGEPHRIEFEKPADGSWTRNSPAQEGASMFKRNGIYYLGGAEFYKGRYSSVMAMSTNVFGPYKNWEEAVRAAAGRIISRTRKAIGGTPISATTTSRRSARNRPS